DAVDPGTVKVTFSFVSSDSPNHLITHVPRPCAVLTVLPSSFGAAVTTFTGSPPVTKLIDGLMTGASVLVVESVSPPSNWMLEPGKETTSPSLNSLTCAPTFQPFPVPRKSETWI